MSVSTAIVPALGIGFAFGWFLQKAGLARSERIVNVFRFRDLAVLQFLMSALLTASVGIQLLRSLGLAADFPVPATYLGGNLLGGVIFGIGMALSGFCPGTVAAGAGEGRLDTLIAGGLGLYTGAVVYGLGYDRVMPAVARWRRLGTVTAAELLNVEPWLVIVLFAELALLVLYVVERGLARPLLRGAPRSGCDDQLQEHSRRRRFRRVFR